MKRDFVPAVAFTVLLHSAILWYTRGKPNHIVPAKTDSDTPMQIFELPPPPPPEPDPVEDSNPPPPDHQEAPATIIDQPTLAPEVAFVQPVQPTPVDYHPNKDLKVIPVDYRNGDGSGIKIWDENQLSQTPTPTARPDPTYPFQLKREGISGKAVVDFVVDSNGNVLRPYTVSSDQPEFARAAVEGVRRWHFRPGMKDGRPVNTHMQIPIVFSLNND